MGTAALYYAIGMGSTGRKGLNQCVGLQFCSSRCEDVLCNSERDLLIYVAFANSRFPNSE